MSKDSTGAWYHAFIVASPQYLVERNLNLSRDRTHPCFFRKIVLLLKSDRLGSLEPMFNFDPDCATRQYR